MDIFNQYIKVRVGLCYITGDPEERHSGTFHDRLYTKEEEIRSRILLQLNDSIGLFNWAILFVQLTPHSKNFFADIWVNNYDDYAKVFYTIRDHLNEYNLTPFYKGTVDQLLTQELVRQGI